MKRSLIALFALSIALWSAEAQEKSMEELEKENQLLEMKLKNEKLKKELEDSKKSDEEKKAEKIAEAKEILEGVFKKPSKDEKRSGKLWGIGIGGTATSIQTPIGTSLEYKSQTSILLDTQYGGITMWNRYFGVQYYGDIDLGIVLDDRYSGWSAVLTTYTFNADAVLNAYNSDSFGVGFLVGLGVGVKYDYFSYKSIVSGGNFGFDARANLGMRLIFGSSYALDFMARFPFMTQSTGLTYWGDSVQYKEDASFSVRFTMGTF